MPRGDFDKGFSKHECQKSAVRERSEQALFWHKCFKKPLSKSPIGIEYYSNAKKNSDSFSQKSCILHLCSVQVLLHSKIRAKYR